MPSLAEFVKEARQQQGMSDTMVQMIKEFDAFRRNYLHMEPEELEEEQEQGEGYGAVPEGLAEAVDKEYLVRLAQVTNGLLEFMRGRHTRTRSVYLPFANLSEEDRKLYQPMAGLCQFYGPVRFPSGACLPAPSKGYLWEVTRAGFVEAPEGL